MYKTFLAILVSSLCLGADFKIYSYDIIKSDGELVIDGISIEVLFLRSLFLNFIFFELNNFISLLSFKRIYFFNEGLLLPINLSKKSKSFKAFKKSELNPTSTTLNFDL